MAVPDFLIWHCAGCGAPAVGKTKPCGCTTNVGVRKGPNGENEQTWWDDPPLKKLAGLSNARILEMSRHYILRRASNGDHDNLKAIRFARKVDAETMCRYMFPGEPHRIADHMWCP